MQKPKIVTIRIPFEIWKMLRELQTDGKIKSIQQASIKGLRMVIEETKGEKDV
jgi:hypothetical protein